MDDIVFIRIIRFVIAFLTLVISTLSILALIGSYYGGSFQIFAFYGLFQPLMIIFNFIFLIYWITRKAVMAFIPFLALILNIGFISSIYQMPSHSAKQIPDNTSKIVLGTYNVHGFYHGERSLTVHLIADFMKDNNVDILCLQEMDYDSVFTVDSIARTFEMTHYSVAYSEKIGFNLMLLSKYPILNTTKINFGHEGNQAMQSDLLVNGDTIRLFNFHLQTTNFNQTKFPLIPENWLWDPSGEAHKSMNIYSVLQENFRKRTSQAAYLHQKIKASPYPTLVCGDMNSNTSSYTYHQIKDKIKDGFQTCGSGYEYTMIGLFRLYRIDYIFHTKDFDGYKYQSYQLDYSDHKTVIMNLGLK